MIAEIQSHEPDHSSNTKMNDDARRTIQNFRFYLDQKFGHGFFHMLVNKNPQVGTMYINQQYMDDKILTDLFYSVSKLVKLSVSYLLEDFNLYLFKGSPKNYY